jgi:hypothetical protein
MDLGTNKSDAGVRLQGTPRHAMHAQWLHCAQGGSTPRGLGMARQLTFLLECSSGPGAQR